MPGPRGRAAVHQKKIFQDGFARRASGIVCRIDEYVLSIVRAFGLPLVVLERVPRLLGGTRLVAHHLFPCSAVASLRPAGVRLKSIPMFPAEPVERWRGPEPSPRAAIVGIRKAPILP
jgi:hypothetical protein